MTLIEFAARKIEPLFDVLALDYAANWYDNTTSMQLVQSRTSYVDAVERALKDAILGGEFTPGSKLPPERELALRFDINRVTLRTALTRLGQAGLLEVRQGRGYTVRDYQKHATLEIVGDLLRLGVGKRSVELLEDLLRLRRGLVIAVADALPRGPGRHTEFRAAAEDLLSRMEKAPNPTEVMEIDLELTRRIVQCTGSVVLRMFLNPLEVAARSLPDLSQGHLPNAERTLAGWRGFLHWLDSERRDPVDLYRRMVAHDEQTLTVLRAQVRP